jgi:hypothetical protein
LPLQRPARLNARYHRIAGLNPGLRPAFEYHHFFFTGRQPAGGHLRASATLTNQHKWFILGEVANAQLNLFQRDVDRARKMACRVLRGRADVDPLPTPGTGADFLSRFCVDGSVHQEPPY